MCWVIKFLQFIERVLPLCRTFDWHRKHLSRQSGHISNEEKEKDPLCCLPSHHPEVCLEEVY